MAIELNVGSMDAVPENIRPFVTEAEGKFSLDETKVKTQTDIDNVLEAKRKESNDRKAAEDALKPFKALGKSAEEIAAILNAPPAAVPNVQNSHSPAFRTKKHSLFFAHIVEICAGAQYISMRESLSTTPVRRTRDRI